MVALTLIQLELQRGGFDATLGLDRHFLNRAPAAAGTCGRSRARSNGSIFSRAWAAAGQLVAATLDGAETELAQAEDWRREGRRPGADRAPAAERHGKRRRKGATRCSWAQPALAAETPECFAAQRCFVVVGAAHAVGPDGR
jgi:hypothetical protein